MKIDMKLLTQTNCKNTGYERYLLRIAINTRQPNDKKPPKSQTIVKN